MTTTLKFVGSLALEGDEFSVEFSASLAEDSRLVLELEPVDQSCWVFVAGRVDPGIGASMIEYSLTGESPDGSIFSSANVTIPSAPSSSECLQLKTVVHEATIRRPASTSGAVPLPKAELLLRGLWADELAPVMTRHGKLSVSGSHAFPDCDKLYGAVLLEAVGAPLETWHRDAYAYLENVQRGLSFASGKRLQCASYRYSTRDYTDVTFFDGRSSGHGFGPVQYPITQEGFLKVLVTKLDEPEGVPCWVWQAASWVFVDTTLQEIRFLSAMTAIELIVNKALPKELRGGSLVSSEKQEKLLAELTDTLSNANLAETEENVLGARLKGIYSKPLGQKVISLFDHCNLPSEDLEESVIRHLIDLRNRIVHQRPVGDVSIGEAAKLAKEVVVLVVLRWFGYVGAYNSYSRGTRATRELPPLSS